MLFINPFVITPIEKVSSLNQTFKVLTFHLQGRYNKVLIHYKIHKKKQDLFNEQIN